MSIIADLIVKVTMNIKDEDGNLDKDLIDEVKSEVLSLCQDYPMYVDLLK